MRIIIIVITVYFLIVEASTTAGPFRLVHQGPFSMGIGNVELVHECSMTKKVRREERIWKEVQKILQEKNLDGLTVARAYRPSGSLLSQAVDELPN